MEAATFYTWAAEASKFILYVIYLIMIGIGLYQRKQGNTKWAGWIHAVVFLNFIIGGLYGGARMLTTDPENNMLIRRMFAWEAYFCFACASFYFLALYLVRTQKSAAQ